VTELDLQKFKSITGKISTIILKFLSGFSVASIAAITHPPQTESILIPWSVFCYKFALTVSFVVVLVAATTLQRSRKSSWIKLAVWLAVFTTTYTCADVAAFVLRVVDAVSGQTLGCNIVGR
jgi:hypothetical protein